jgi:hypothetical protein
MLSAMRKRKHISKSDTPQVIKLHNNLCHAASYRITKGDDPVVPIIDEPVQLLRDLYYFDILKLYWEDTKGRQLTFMINNFC